MTETYYLLLVRKEVQAQIRFVENYHRDLFQVFELPKNRSERLAKLMQQYADLPMDLADASLVILAKHLGKGRILSVDQRDFNTYRWNSTKPFQIFLL